MDSVPWREVLQNYRELLQAMLEVSRGQLQAASGTPLEGETLEEFNRLTAARQALMESIDALPVKFAEIRDRQDLAAEVEQVMDIVKAIAENDRMTAEFLREKAAVAAARVLEVQTGKKAMKAYNKEDETIAPWFFDTRK